MKLMRSPSGFSLTTPSRYASPPLTQVASTLAGNVRPVTGDQPHVPGQGRSEEHTSELQSLMRISYAVFCLKKKKKTRDRRHKTKTQIQRKEDTQKEENITIRPEGQNQQKIR